jgi:hypothetical protein
MNRQATVLILTAAISVLGPWCCGSSEEGASDHCEMTAWPAARDPAVHAQNFPDWAFDMRVWPFDILRPNMSEDVIDENLAAAEDEDATTVIFYIEEEHMYSTFVDEAGFTQILEKIGYLTEEASSRGLNTIVYVNGLEVMTRGAFDGDCDPTGIPTMESEHADWLQIDLDGEPIVFICQNTDWLDPDWEDAWMSPLSGYRSLFKDRIERLADAGVNGVYIDATFLPGFQSEDEDFRWASSDPAFAQKFEEETGFEIPEAPDVDDEAFREFLLFRHRVLAEYLGDLADTAWNAGIVPFWESSTNDTQEGTWLGNETAVTGRSGLGFSPEIEPEGDWFAAFRMAKAGRELNQERPMIFLGWPTNKNQAAMEFAVTLAHSNNYYPTDFLVAEGAFDLMDEIDHILKQRVPYAGNLAMVYSVRNKDFTLSLDGDDEWVFESYVMAFEDIVALHLPFKIVPLEYIESDGLDGTDIVVLPELPAIADEEADAISPKIVVRYGDNIGIRDEGWDKRDQALAFDNEDYLEDLCPALPFGLDAPKDTFIEFYGDRDGAEVMYLFAVSENPAGEIVIYAGKGTTLSVTSYRLDNDTVEDSGNDEIHVDVDARLIVMEIKPK